MNPTVKAFAQLIKFRLTASVAATSVFGYLLGCKLNADGDWKSLFDWITFSGVLIGGMLVVFEVLGFSGLAFSGICQLPIEVECRSEEHTTLFRSGSLFLIGLRFRAY